MPLYRRMAWCFLPQNPSTGNGKIPGCTFILSVDTANHAFVCFRVSVEFEVLLGTILGVRRARAAARVFAGQPRECYWGQGP